MWINIIPVKGSDILCKPLDDNFEFIRFQCKSEEDINKSISEQIKGDYEVKFKFSSKKFNDNELFYVVKIAEEIETLEILTKDRLYMLPYSESSNFMRVIEAMIDLDIDYKQYWIVEEFMGLPQNSQWNRYVINRRIRKKRILDKTKKANGIILVYSLILSIIFDFLMGKGMADLRPLGINVALFNSLFLICFFVNNRKNIKKSILGFSFLLISIISSIYFGVYNVSFVRGLNIVVLPVINILLANTFMYKFNLSLRVLGTFLGETISSAFALIAVKIKRLRKKVTINKVQTNHKESFNAIIIGVVIFIPLAFILVSLLSKSDLYFSHFISSLGTNLKELFTFKNIKIESVMVRAILMIMMFLYSVSFLLGTSDYESEAKINNKEGVSPLILVSFLTGLLGLYTIYSLIQFPNLYINKNSIGALYAQYAREGFMQLVIVVIINFIIIALFSYLTRKTVNYKKVLNIQYTYLIVLTFNMIISSNYKMNIYIDEYGFTRLRFSVKVILTFLGAAFILYIINIWRRFAFNKALIIVLFGFFVFINVINIDGYIVKKNLKHYKETGKIDVYYITEKLSIDSLVEINKIKDEEEYSALRNEFEEALNKSIEYDDFREFNVSKYKLLSSR